MPLKTISKPTHAGQWDAQRQADNLAQCAKTVPAKKEAPSLACVGPKGLSSGPVKSAST
jgi:hypothetical protein